MDPHYAVTRALEMIDAGATIIDIGAESTRPGSHPVSAAVQIQRLSGVIPVLTAQTTVPISIDTTSSEVAAWGLEHGASMINDISGLRFDPELAHVVSLFGATLILTHSRETPLTMQMSPTYRYVVDEVIGELRTQIEIAKNAGVQNLIVDPGIGFGKQLSDNLTLLRELPKLTALGYPILVGTSRKSMISQITGQADVTRIAGSLASAIWAVHSGASFVRVHDVLETRQALLVWSAIQSGVTMPPTG